MSRIYDNWDKLVGAEKDRQTALFQSFSSSSSAAVTSRFSCDSTHEDVCADFAFNPFAGDVHVSSNIYLRDAMVIEYEEIIKATQNFQLGMILEKGRSAIVYKGWIDELNLTAVEPGFGTAVVVHELKNEGQFANEIYYSSELRHRNLVKHIGYCFNSNNIILVHEFVSGGSLDNHLFTSKVTCLESITCFIHRDFKSANILLDDDFNAKLSNFGLAIDDAPACLSTEVVGYPTTRCDVYAFGVVLSELIFGLRVLDISRPKGKHNLMDWAKPYLRDKKKLLQVMDSRLEGDYPHKEAYKVAKVALRCVISDPRLRPTMAEIVAALQHL